MIDQSGLCFSDLYAQAAVGGSSLAYKQQFVVAEVATATFILAFYGLWALTHAYR